MPDHGARRYEGFLIMALSGDTGPRFDRLDTCPRIGKQFLLGPTVGSVRRWSMASPCQHARGLPTRHAVDAGDFPNSIIVRYISVGSWLDFVADREITISSAISSIHRDHARGVISRNRFRAGRSSIKSSRSWCRQSRFRLGRENMSVWSSKQGCSKSVPYAARSRHSENLPQKSHDSPTRPPVPGTTD